MEDFEKKISIKESMEIEEGHFLSSKNKEILHLLRIFLDVQQRRAQAYSKLKTGFSEYINSGGELAYQQLCSEITIEFNDCSKQVLEMESLFLNPDYCPQGHSNTGKAEIASELSSVFAAANCLSQIWLVLN